MQVRKIAIPTLAGLAGLLLVALVLEARGDRGVELDEHELAQARAAHQRAGARESPATTAPSPRRRTARQTPAATAPSRSREPAERSRPIVADSPEPAESGESLEERMDAANKLYDRADYMGSRDAALAILAEHPDNVRMLRIVVSASCIVAEPDQAREFYAKLPARDQRQMARRCKRYGVEF